MSPQAVQKWEQGTSQPSVNNLINIAKYFNVSVDSLLLDSNGRIIEEMREKNALFPDFSGMHTAGVAVCSEYHTTVGILGIDLHPLPGGEVVTACETPTGADLQEVNP